MTKPAANKKAAKKTPLPSVDTDTALSRYRELLEAMTLHGVHESRSWDAYWEAVDEVLEGRLYLLSPNTKEHKAEQWCVAHTKLSLDACRRYSLVARFCSPDDEMKYGIAKLHAVLRYIDKKVGGLPERGGLKLKLKALRFPVLRGKKTTQLGIQEATMEEILALANDRKPGKLARPSQLSKAFQNAFEKERGFEDSDFVVRDGMLHMRNIPLTHIAQFTKLIRTVDWKAARPK